MASSSVCIDLGERGHVSVIPVGNVNGYAHLYVTTDVELCAGNKLIVRGIAYTASTHRTLIQNPLDPKNPPLVEPWPRHASGSYQTHNGRLFSGRQGSHARKPDPSPLGTSPALKETMKTYIASFWGKLKGAIGKSCRHSVQIEAEDETTARLKLYETHEHIFYLTLTEVQPEAAK